MIVYVSSSGSTVITDPCWSEVLSLMNFESALTTDAATARSNTWTSAGSISRDASAALTGSYGCLFDSANNANIQTTGSNFRADTSLPWCFELFFNPISSPIASGGTSVFRNCIACLSSATPITIGANVTNIWWHSGSGGTLGFSNSGISTTGIASATKHHIAIQYDSGNTTYYADGNRIGFTVSNLANFNTILLGNMASYNQLYDGTWSDYVTRGKIDDARFTYDCVRYSGTTYTVPDGPFPSS